MLGKQTINGASLGFEPRVIELVHVWQERVKYFKITSFGKRPEILAMCFGQQAWLLTPGVRD
jgi:hypothetical protein